jgi:serine/threonine protein kinase
MYNLVGGFIQDEPQENIDDDTVLFPFKLILPGKTRKFYLLTEDEKNQWIKHIKKVIGYASIQDFYDFGDVIGRGKFGAVKTAVHKKTGKKVAIKILKKKEMNIREIEMQKNEIEILKVCQHPNIIRLLDIFENQDHQYIGNLKNNDSSDGILGRRRSICILGKKRFQS